MRALKVVLYARVSTDDKGQEPQVQLDHCRQYAELHCHEVVCEVLDEESGQVPFHQRQGGKQVLDLIRRSKANGLVVFAVDRYSRGSPITVLQELKHFNEMGVTFISITEPVFNSEGPLAEPVQYLLTWFSNYFLTQHQEKVCAGLERARRRGKHLGRPPRRRIDEQLARYFLGLGPDSQGNVINKPLSLRASARRLGVPVSTLHNWRKAYTSCSAQAEESKQGEQDGRATG